MLPPDPAGVGDAHPGQRSQSVQLTETRAGTGLSQQNARVLQRSLRLLPRTSATRRRRGAQAWQLGSYHEEKPVFGVLHFQTCLFQNRIFLGRSVPQSFKGMDTA